MPTSTDTERLLQKVSTLYYEQNYNQQEIANRLVLSRPKVSRLLKKARKKGIVKISVKKHQQNYVELENKLETIYELKEAVIIKLDDTASEESLRTQIGAASADYLYRTIKDGDTIGLTWGKTLQAMTDAMTDKEVENTHVMQTLGGVGAPEAKAHATDISRRFAQSLNSKLTLLPSPGITGSMESKNVLLSDPNIQKSLSLFSDIDTLFVGIGAISTNPVLDQNSNEITNDVYQEICNSGAVGDIALRFFDINGKEIASKLRDLVIGISLDQIKALPTVVGVATGPQKVKAIKGALNGQLIDVLITDSQTAKSICSEPME